MTMFAPCSASASTIDFPIPVFPPVTTATLPGSVIGPPRRVVPPGTVGVRRRGRAPRRTCRRARSYYDRRQDAQDRGDDSAAGLVRRAKPVLQTRGRGRERGARRFSDYGLDPAGHVTRPPP